MRTRVADAFFDTNVLLYLLSADAPKADRASDLLERGGMVSVQVLNEFASVATRKLHMTIAEMRDILATVRQLCEVSALDLATHDRALDIAEQHHLSIFDALIVASALDAGCTTLWSEDLPHGHRIEGLTIRNPFIG
jgi:predicted nucleic acid-binding protein